MLRPLSNAGLVVLPLALAVVLGGLSARAVAANAGGDARVPLEVAGVLALPDGQSCILVLRERGRSTLLPVVLPRQDPDELRDGLKSRRTPGLLGEALHRLGARVREVEISGADDSRRSSRVRLSQGGRELELAARTSESVLLAVAEGAPIVASRRLLADAGLEPEDLRKAKQKLAGPGRAPVRL